MKLDHANNLLQNEERMAQIFRSLKLSHFLAIPNSRDLLSTFIADFEPFRDGTLTPPGKRKGDPAVKDADFLLPYRDEAACAVSPLAGLVDHFAREADNMSLDEFDECSVQMDAEAAAAFFELAALGCAVARTPMKFGGSANSQNR